jgi:hypothetical protein
MVDQASKADAERAFLQVWDAVESYFPARTPEHVSNALKEAFFADGGYIVCTPRMINGIASTDVSVPNYVASAFIRQAEAMRHEKPRTMRRLGVFVEDVPRLSIG